MNKKLIFFDIDGTLVTEGDQNRVPESTLDALKKLRANGHICIINTGRPFVALDDTIRQIPVDGYVCGCGTYIYINDQVLLDHRLNVGLCGEIIKMLDQCRLEWMLEDQDGIYYSKCPYTTGVGQFVKNMKRISPTKVHCIEPEEYDGTRFVKFIFMTTNHSDYKKFYEAFQDRLDFIDRGNTMYEVVPKGYSKATGMQFLENYYHIAYEDTFAVGDSTNDIPMLEYANVGILMGGAPLSLRSYAQYVTTAIEDDGIYQAFRHFEMI